VVSQSPHGGNDGKPLSVSRAHEDFESSLFCPYFFPIFIFLCRGRFLSPRPTVTCADRLLVSSRPLSRRLGALSQFSFRVEREAEFLFFPKLISPAGTSPPPQLVVFFFSLESIGRVCLFERLSLPFRFFFSSTLRFLIPIRTST